jgi:hypothetical protein
MEQSPIIPQDIINKFIKTFRKVKNVKMPEICNKLEPTTIYSELFDLHQTALENKNIDTTIITASDKSIIKSVSDKVASFFTSTPKPNVNTTNSDTENDNVVITIKDEENKNIVNYSNTLPGSPTVVQEPPIVENKPETILEETNVAPTVEKPIIKPRVMAKQLIYGKK